MTNYPSIEQKIKRYSGIIKCEHSKKKCNRRPDLAVIVTKQNNLQRWLKELKQL